MVYILYLKIEVHMVWLIWHITIYCWRNFNFEHFLKLDKFSLEYSRYLTISSLQGPYSTMNAIKLLLKKKKEKTNGTGHEVCMYT